MGRKSTRSIPKKDVITVKENPLDTAAEKYIALFSQKASSKKSRKLQKQKGNTGAGA